MIVEALKGLSRINNVLFVEAMDSSKHALYLALATKLLQMRKYFLLHYHANGGGYNR